MDPPRPAPADSLAAACQSKDLSAVISKLRAMAAGGGPEDEATTASFVNLQDCDGRTALHWAVGLRSWAVVEALLDPAQGYDADTNTVDYQLSTPLSTACSVDAPLPIFLKLLQRSMPVIDAKNDVGNTALILASSRGSVLIVRELLKHLPPSSLMHQNNTGQSALHRAVSRNSSETAEELIAAARKAFPDKTQFRVFMNLADKNGDTALHYASMENNQEIGQLLIRSGADKERRNKAGKLFWEL